MNQLLAAAIQPQRRQTHQDQRHFPVAIEDLGCNQADQHAAQRAAGGEAEIEVSQISWVRFAACELTMTHEEVPL